MLAITIFSSIVGDMLPITDTTPLIGNQTTLTQDTHSYWLAGMYFSCIMFMVSSSCITTILILNYHHRLADTHEMPDWVAAVFLQWLPWLLHMSRQEEELQLLVVVVVNGLFVFRKYVRSFVNRTPVRVEYQTMQVSFTGPFQTRREDHEEDNHDVEQTERA